jgi:hypothetical protein
MVGSREVIQECSGVRYRIRSIFSSTVPLFDPSCSVLESVLYTDKKENEIFLLYKEIQSGAVAKSYIRKGFLVNEEMRKYFPVYEGRRPLAIYDFAIAPF